MALAALILLFSLLPSVGIAAGESPQTTDLLIKQAIRDLGKGGYPDQLATFWQYPQRSTELLLAELKPVPRGKYPNGSHPHVVWCIRALRSLTALDFRGVTRMKLNDDERQFLVLGKDKRVRFFGTWMSRDLVWVAPEDAQRQIISRWKDWFKKNGAGYSYKNDEHVDNWYF
jgi:hypothetical protein